MWVTPSSFKVSAFSISTICCNVGPTIVMEGAGVFYKYDMLDVGHTIVMEGSGVFYKYDMLDVGYTILI